MFQFDPKVWGDNERLDATDNLILTRPFSEEEVKTALFSMNSNRAPRPDNIPAEFYQHYWEIVKKDIMGLFLAFYEGRLDVHRLNYGIITLLPKISGANKIQQFRPIYLLRCPYKLITKVLDNRAAPFADVLFSKHQNAFIKNRHITDGIISLHEILHYTHIRKKVGIVIKLDFEKAYDKVN